MSTTRRPLGTGPTTSTRSTATSSSRTPRLAAELIEREDQAVVDERPAAPTSRGRRTLGTGPEPETVPQVWDGF
ncbi:hypothetical protein ACFCXH_28330 [Streptomyces nojiriensis]|uniref:hypothetical protein n=1 Tax=Streptomyces nojiriensis TaxID=66374 RepID=UPI0035D5B883